MAVFEHVVVATDFSAASRPALDLAVSMAGMSGALHVVHVCEIPSYVDLGVPMDLLSPLTEDAEGRLRELMKTVQARAPGAQGEVRVGVAWEQILAAAAEHGADLIVLGTHGRRGLAHAMMGSVAERVVQLSRVPVLTVRARSARSGDGS